MKFTQAQLNSQFIKRITDSDCYFISFFSNGAKNIFLSLALLTEYLDGALARRSGWVSSIGKTLDPIADRIFAFSVEDYIKISGGFGTLSRSSALKVLDSSVITPKKVVPPTMFKNSEETERIAL